MLKTGPVGFVEITFDMVRREIPDFTLWSQSHAWWYLLVNSALVRWRQEDHEFKTTIGYMRHRQEAGAGLWRDGSDMLFLQETWISFPGPTWLLTNLKEQNK